MIHEWEACVVMSDAHEYVCARCRRRVEVSGMALAQDRGLVGAAMLAAGPCDKPFVKGQL